MHEGVREIGKGIGLRCAVRISRSEHSQILQLPGTGVGRLGTACCGGTTERSEKLGCLTIELADSSGWWPLLPDFCLKDLARKWIRHVRKSALVETVTGTTLSAEDHVRCRNVSTYQS
jgi:hypothetical protein